MKEYKLLKRGVEKTRYIPGRYAGNIKTKIFGRLDCEFGKLTSKKNRVFFASWKAATNYGYRPCEKCKPTQMDKYPEQEAFKASLLATPHIALWESEKKSDYYPYEKERIWHVHLNWQDKHAKPGHYQRTILIEDLPYKVARDYAIETAKTCNLLVLKHGRENFKVIRIPKKRINDIKRARAKRALKELMKINKVTTSSSKGK